MGVESNEEGHSQVSEKRLIFLFGGRPVLAFSCWAAGNSSRFPDEASCKQVTPKDTQGALTKKGSADGAHSTLSAIGVSLEDFLEASFQLDL